MSEVKNSFMPVRRSIRKETRCIEGFTILEAMLAAAVMALAIATSIPVMQRGFTSLDTARNTTIAGQIMQHEIEKMRMKSWAVVGAYSTTGPTTETIDTNFTSNPAIGSRFTLQRNVEVIATTTGIGMRQITYTVSWKGYDGRPHSCSFVTYYGQNGLYDYYYNSI